MTGTYEMNNLTVCGGGVLGAQIGWHSAYQGKDVTIYDISDEALQKCRDTHSGLAEIYQAEVQASAAQVQDTQSRVSYSTDLAEAVSNADVVIEAIPEVPDIKTKFYLELAGLLRGDTILATNSSTLLPGMFAESTGRPERYCALHFANRIWDLNVAEVMAHAGTSEETLTNITRFAIEIGMVPIPVQKEQSGYVVNSLLNPLLNAAAALVVTGVSDHETVDRTFMIMNRGVRMGPFGILDMVGMRTAYNVSSYWGEVNGDEQLLANARYVKEHYIDHGKMGVESGEGFYKYPNPRYLEPDFLDVPDVTLAAELAKLTVPESK